MTIDTDGLRLFVLAAELRNISAAGRRLGMGPAVSSAKLAKLELSVGADLLHRTTRKVSLSVEGAELMPFAREIIAQEDAALAALGKGTAHVSGTLRFAAPSSFAQLHIAPLLPKFLELYPDVTLDLRLSDVQFDLIEGSYDLALRNAPLEDSSLKGRKLANDTRVLCASPAYLAANGTPENPDDLSDHRLIAFRDPQARSLITQDGRPGVFDAGRARSRLIVDDGINQKQITMAGAGISINALWSVHEELVDGRLIRVLPEYVENAENALWLIYPKSNVLSPKVRVFIDFLTGSFGPKPVWERSNRQIDMP